MRVAGAAPVSPHRVVGWGALALGLLLAGTLLSGVLIPIYIDETAVLLGHARWLDGGATLAPIFPQCGDGASTIIPSTWWPGALVYELVFAHADPFQVRVIGVAFGLALLAGFALLARYALAAAEWRPIYGLLALSALSLGTLPYVLALTRPEPLQALILLLLVGAWALMQGRGKGPLPARVVLALVIAGLVSSFYFLHTKAILFTPFLVALFAYSWRFFGKAGSSLLIAATLITAAQTYQGAVAAMQCSGAPILQGALTRYAITVQQLVADPAGFFVQGAINLWTSLRLLIHHASLAPTVQAWWLPTVDHGSLGGPVAAINGLIVLLLGGGVIAVIALVSVRCFTGVSGRRLTDHRVLAFLLMLGVLAQAFLYTRNWFFYNVALAVPVLLLAVFFVLREVAGAGSPVKSWHAWAVSGAGVVAASSLSLLLALYLPALITTNELPWPHLSRQVFSTQALHARSQIAAVREMAPYCGLSTAHETSLLVDDLTFHAFDRLERPVHVLNVSEETPTGGDLKGRLAGFLSQRGGKGFIMRCERVPPQLRSRIGLRHAGYCCGGVAP